MKNIMSKIKSALHTKPSNAFLLFLTGFFFSQFMLINMLSIKNPLGGWVTSFGTLSNSSILAVSLLALSLCLIALWRTTESDKNSKDTNPRKATVTKINNNYSPIDYPRGSTQAVVPGYAVG